ncbi:MAG: hypothetical protein OZ921_07600 [Sorangiineae bacterium]|nr:hypothetical protein [Polyangiaceae bacterium]MEB2322361.1 hypothetical protein [Sorangiineae bacterium]
MDGATLEDFQTLSLEGQATSALMNREARTRSRVNESRAEVVREIAAERGPMTRTTATSSATR